MGHPVSEETRAKMSGSNSTHWRGGISKLPYAFDFDKELKELIKKRDEYNCQFPDCGTDVDLVVHHINYDKLNSDPFNLITLCRSHNIKVNSNRDYWEIYFTLLTSKPLNDEGTELIMNKHVLSWNPM